MTQPDPGLIPAINESLQINLPEKISSGELKEKLAEYINQLIQSDFEKLVSLLYRIDVSETKLKQLLAGNPPGDAGMIIAELIIERQIQKTKIRQQFRQERKTDIDENEKW